MLMFFLFLIYFLGKVMELRSIVWMSFFVFNFKKKDIYEWEKNKCNLYLWYF